MASDNNLNPSALDAVGRRMYPWLRKALTKPRFSVVDDRLLKDNLFEEGACGDGVPIGQFYGTGAVLNDNGAVTDLGSYADSIVLDVGNWDTSLLTNWVTSIILEEVIGYDVTHFLAANLIATTERMSSVGRGACTPTHANVETWADGKIDAMNEFSNSSYSPGGVGYLGQGGVYTTRDFVVAADDGASPNTYGFTAVHYADFWKSYKYEEELAASVPLFDLQSSAYPPSSEFCADGTTGCLNGCSRSYACTQAEANSKICMVITMMYENYDKAYVQAMVSNNEIAAYFCFIGYSGSQAYVTERRMANASVVFYHWEPDRFHQLAANVGKFQRISFPVPSAEKIMASTSDFGENGYGLPTNNPLDVDFALQNLAKYISSRLQDNGPALSFFSKLSISQFQIDGLLQSLSSIDDASHVGINPHFEAACTFVKSSFSVWKNWVATLPLCTSEHLKFEITGCEDSHRSVVFSWKKADPEDENMPYDCDGGPAKPSTLLTSRSCEWLQDNREEWLFWARKRPECDATFYHYTVSECDAGGGGRGVVFAWLLPNPADATTSLECSGDASSLPSDTIIDCEYAPSGSPTVVVMVVFCSLCMAFYTLLFLQIYMKRKNPIMSRSQYEFLLIMLVGAFMNGFASINYAGPPRIANCFTRPVFLSSGFTITVGALLVKSMRIQKIFMSKSFKKVRVTVRQMIVHLTQLLVVDLCISAVWFIVDPPVAEFVETNVVGVGLVNMHMCRTSGTIFQIIHFMYKGGLLMYGLKVAFEIRKVGGDFQESPQVAACIITIFFGSLIVMPAVYAMDITAVAAYAIQVGVTMFCTTVVAFLVISPKLLRLRKAGKVAADASEAESTTVSDQDPHEMIEKMKERIEDLKTENIQLKNKISRRPSVTGLKEDGSKTDASLTTT